MTFQHKHEEELRQLKKRVEELEDMRNQALRKLGETISNICAANDFRQGGVSKMAQIMSEHAGLIIDALRPFDSGDRHAEAG